MKPPEKKLGEVKPPVDPFRFEVQSGGYYHIAWCATWKEAEERVHAEIRKDLDAGKAPKNIKYVIFERGATYTLPIEDIIVRRVDALAGSKTYVLPRS